MNKHLITRGALAAILALGASALVVGCGDDEEAPAKADCSDCSADAMDICNQAAQACVDNGVAVADCQPDIDVICAITGGLLDGGLGGGGTGGTGGGGPDGG